jgi:hypothetical protein
MAKRLLGGQAVEAGGGTITFQNNRVCFTRKNDQSIK